MSAAPDGAHSAATVVAYALRLGDDALVLAQRLSQWVARAPEIEEDVAVANIALDLLGQARALLTYAGEREGLGRTEDDLAFLREEREFRNVQLVEQENGDFARTVARQLLFSTYQHALYDRLSHSADARLAAIAGKAVKEVAYHRDHAVQWTVRLGDGTAESHRRMQAGLEGMWPFTSELFEADDVVRRLAGAGVAVDPAGLEPDWTGVIEAVLAEATLVRPATDWRPGGGRRGVHTESFGYLVAEMQHLHRSYPGARW
ncbi:MAG: 1,2-phenylacetyl-CoA epoxidase subunit PaaC [Carbonactinosporaceae bacterium]